MQFRTLGKTGLKVSLVSFGSGGPSRLGQHGRLTDRQQDALVRRALDLGINLIDTSAVYDRSEEILGRALAGIPRDSYILATKWLPTAHDELKEDPQQFQRALERSLTRLRTDYVDLMQIHAIQPAHYDTVVERFYPTLKKFKDEGKARFIGFSERFFKDPSHESVTHALKTDPGLWDTIMLKYGILNQSAAKEIFPLALRHNVGILNMASVRVKLTRPEELETLMMQWRERGLIPADSLPAADPLGWLVGDGVESVVSAGYKFAADHPAIATVITGTSSLANLERNVAALERPRLPTAAKRKLVELFGELAEPA